MTNERAPRRPRSETSWSKVALDLVPSFPDAEEFALGALLEYPEAMRLYIEKGLRPEHFPSGPAAAIAAIAWEVYEQGEAPDVFAILNRAVEQGKLEEIGGEDYLQRLRSKSAISAADVGRYAKALLDLDVRRKLIRLSDQFRLLAHRPEGDGEHLLGEVRRAIEDLSSTQAPSNLQAVHDIMPVLISKLAERAENPNIQNTVATGFPDLDRGYFGGGWNRNDLVILAARPGVGKTSFALSTARHAARHVPVAIFNLEMSGDQLTTRLLSLDARVDSQKLRQPQTMEEGDWVKLHESISRFDPELPTSFHPIYIDDTPGLSFIQLRTTCRDLRQRGVGLFIIDYLQLMQTDGAGGDANRTQELSRLTRNLKQLARELQSPLIVLSQLSRAVEQRPNHRPVLSDLRESGSIEQDSDIVMFIHRPDMYDKSEDGANPIANDGESRLAELIIAKNRSGPVGTVAIQFNPALTEYVTPTGPGGFERLPPAGDEGTLF